MDEMIMKNHLRKVNKVMIGILLLFMLITLSYGISNNMLNLYIVSAFFLSIAIFVWVSSRTKKFETISAYITIIAVGLITVYLVTGSAQIYMILTPISIAALYLNKKLFFITSAIINLTVIANTIITNQINPDFYVTMILVNIIVIILFFMTKWGTDLVKLAAIESDKSNSTLGSLRETLNLIETTSLSLNRDIKNCTTNLEKTTEISTEMVRSVQEVAKGVIEQAESINKISLMMNEAGDKAIKTQNISKELSTISSQTSRIVSDGSDRINKMNNQMDIITGTVNESVSTVRELARNMNDVNNFLGNITNISKQTNLLALNAAIEASRAGESGKGFAVVADEIRKLAEQSATTVNQISEIIKIVNDKTENVINKVENGNIAVKEGESIVREVCNNFENILSSFKEIDKYIANEYAMMEETTLILSKIRDESEGIATIAEEHSAMTQEMQSIMENQKSSINGIYNSMQEIQSAGENLQSITINN